MVDIGESVPVPVSSDTYVRVMDLIIRSTSVMSMLLPMNRNRLSVSWEPRIDFCMVLAI